MKKLLCLVIGLVMVFFMGCSKQGGSSSGNGKTVVVWHWLTDREDSLNELADKYKKEKGITVKFELYAPSEVYFQKVRAAAQAKTLPDIYGILSDKKDFASFIKSGHVLNVTPFMDADNGAWRKSLFEKAVAVNEFPKGNVYDVEPGVYGVPIDVMNIPMLYNKGLFKKAGLDPNKPPKTWDEFLADCKKLKAAGIPGFVSGWGEVWLIENFADNYALNIMGKEKFLATIKGDVKYTDPDWIKVFTLFKDLVDNDCLVPGTVTMINKQSEQTFANSKAAFAFNGSWCVNVYNGMNPDLEYGVMLPPRISNKNPMLIEGAAGGSFIVNAASPNRQEAVDFLKWLTEKDQQTYLTEKTRNLPSSRSALSSIPALLKDFASLMDNTWHPALMPYNENPIVVETYEKGIQSILIGEKTPEQVAKDVQDAKDRVMKK